MDCYVCGKSLPDACSDELSFCSQLCALEYIADIPAEFEPPMQDCNCPECLYDRMIDMGFDSQN
jgi:hypothetical protein